MSTYNFTSFPIPAKTIEAADVPFSGTGFTATDVDAALDELQTDKQDALTAGTGISIVNNVISVSLTNANTQSF